MEAQSIFEKLPEALSAWYKEAKRDLPWRRDRQPYHIWVSEVMLQQTRVEAVKGYYARFLSALPTIEDLANADDELLHKLWEGLGYYSRARNLKKAAQQIVQLHSSRFPTSYEEIRALPGIGDYTAGAICSIAYDLPTPAVDGNVLRVISRLTNDATTIDSPAFKKAARSCLAAVYPRQAGDFTQALMELGATVCGPNRKPDCDHCPCSSFCLGHQHGTAEHLPVRKPKAGRKHEKMTVFILRCDGAYALQKRPKTGLLADLWQFPNVSGWLDLKEAIATVEKMAVKPKDVLRVVERKHIFTHIEWEMRGVYMETGDINAEFVWMRPEEIASKAALPTAFRQFWEEIEIV